MELGEIKVKGNLRSQFGNAMSYRALKRENPEMAAAWREIMKDISENFTETEKVLMSSAEKSEKVGLLLTTLNYGADQVNMFNRISGLKAELQTEFSLMGVTVMKVISKPNA